MKFNVTILNLALAMGMIGMAHCSSIPVMDKVKAKVAARLAELKGSELTGRQQDWCNDCLYCGPSCNACCCCYGGCHPGAYQC